MANINKAFKLHNDPDIINSPNCINNNFVSLDCAFDRIKTSNTKYDDITRFDKTATYGYICQLCNGTVGYHMAIQNKYPHDFIKGNYVKLNE